MSSQNEMKTLHNFFMQAPAVFAILKGPEHVFELANPAYVELIGNRNPVGKTVREALPELEGQGFYELLDHVYSTGEPFVGKEMLASIKRNKKLDHIYINFYYQAYKNDQGKVEGILVFAYEVTELVKARKQTEINSEEFQRFKHMADNATEPFILMREDGTFAYLNDVALERWGYKREEAAHIRVPDVDPIYNDELFKQVFAQAQKEKIPQFETLHKKKDGTIYPVEVNMGGLIFNDKPLMFAIARDISERKKSEEKLKQYYEDLEVKVKFRNIELERKILELQAKIDLLEKK